jgi:hypothetical protein
MKSELPPLFPIFYGHHTDNSRDSHCDLSDEEDGGYTVSRYLYRDIVATSIVTSALPSLLMHSSDSHADVTMPVTTDNAYRY